MKTIHTILIVIVLIGVSYLVYGQWQYQQKSSYSTTVPTTFQVGGDTFAVDLLGRSVTLPAGQLWGFNTDQKISVKVVSTKAIEDNVVVIVEVMAVADIAMPKEKDKGKEKEADKKAPPPGTPKAVTLEGMLKMLYERVNGKWYLIQLEGVSLRVTAG